jgi:hypothetical protein
MGGRQEVFMTRRSRYERVDRYPMGRAPRPYYDSYDEELSEIRRTPYGYQSVDEFDDLQPAGVPRRRFRRLAVRLIGALAIGGAFYGIAQIAIHPEARRAITEWVTLGHAEKVEGVERTVQKWVDRVREP